MSQTHINQYRNEIFSIVISAVYSHNYIVNTVILVRFLLSDMHPDFSEIFYTSYVRIFTFSVLIASIVTVSSADITLISIIRMLTVMIQGY